MDYLEGYEAFIYLWYDAPNKRYYLGKHKGTPNDSYTHSSTVWKNFTKDNIPKGVRRRILAYGTNEEMCILEHKFLVNRKERHWDRYYNNSLGDPRYVDQSGVNNHNFKCGLHIEGNEEALRLHEKNRSYEKSLCSKRIKDIYDVELERKIYTARMDMTNIENDLYESYQEYREEKILHQKMQMEAKLEAEQLAVDITNYNTECESEDHDDLDSCSKSYCGECKVWGTDDEEFEDLMNRASEIGRKWGMNTLECMKYASNAMDDASNALLEIL